MKGIYLIKCDVENKVYIGQSKNIRKRCVEHLSRLRLKKHPNSYLQEAFNKCGENSFKFEVLYELKDEIFDRDKLYELEIKYISLYDSTNRDKGYNIESGGISSSRFAKETCKKISESHKGKKMSNEVKEKLSKIRKGKPSHWKGKKQTKEHSEKRISQQYGKVWVNNGEISKFVTKEESKNLLEKGFKMGRNSFKWHTGKYEYNGKYYTLTEISKMCGVERSSLFVRLKKGWDMDKATSTPTKKYKLK